MKKIPEIEHSEVGLLPKKKEKTWKMKTKNIFISVTRG